MYNFVFEVNIEIDKNQGTINCDSTQTILDAVKDIGLKLPSPCLADMSYKCDAFLKEGSVEMDAMGLKSELQDEVYILLCQAYPKSDLNLIANQFDSVWAQR